MLKPYAENKLNILFYCQHSMGIGHLTRSFAICDQLTALGEVTFLSGGELPKKWHGSRDRIKLVQMPALSMDAEGLLYTGEPGVSLDKTRANRKHLLREALLHEPPDILIVEMFPFGRKKFAFEILPMIELLKQKNPQALVVCSVRDILVTRRRDQKKHDRVARERLNNYFDLVLVHSDPGYVRLELTFSEFTNLEIPVHYTGFVTPKAIAEVAQPSSSTGQVLVSVGGGRVGEQLLSMALRAQPLLYKRLGLSMFLLTGPFLPEAAKKRLQLLGNNEGLRIEPYVEDLCGEMGRSDLSISQCGYNTMMDVLLSGIPSIVVPYCEAGEDEQLRRAQILHERGRLEVIHPDALSVNKLLQQIEKMALETRYPIDADLRGARNSARLLQTRLEIQDRSRGVKRGFC